MTATADLTITSTITDRYTVNGIEYFVARASAGGGIYGAQSDKWADEGSARIDAEYKVRQQIEAHVAQLAAEIEAEVAAEPSVCPTCADEGDCPDRGTLADDEPSYQPLEDETAATLEYFATEYSQRTRTARMAGDKDGAKFFQRAANSFTKALAYWNDGIRPERTASGNYLLRSQRGPAEAPHLIRKEGDWCCTCAAGDSIHWATAMIIGIEAAADSPHAERIERLHESLDGAAAAIYSAADEDAEREARYVAACAAMDELYS